MQYIFDAPPLLGEMVVYRIKSHCWILRAPFGKQFKVTVKQKIYKAHLQFHIRFYNRPNLLLASTSISIHNQTKQHQ